MEISRLIVDGFIHRNLTYTLILLGNISIENILTSIKRIVAFMAQTECIFRVLGHNKLFSNIDSVKYAI